LLVDELYPLLFEFCQLRVNIRRLEADVVQPLAFTFEEFADGRVRRKRLKQLDLALTDREKRGLDALVFDLGLSVDVELQRVTVELERLVEGVDGDADVVDLLDHLGSLPSDRDAAARSRLNTSLNHRYFLGVKLSAVRIITDYGAVLISDDLLLVFS